MNYRKGFIALLLASLAFSINGVFSKLVLEAGLSPLRLAEVRSTGAFSAFFIYLLLFKRSALRFELKALPEMLIYGIVGYAGVQAFYFIAIVRMPVSVGLIIEFTAAIWITLWVRFVRKQYVPRTMWIAVFLAITGLALIASNIKNPEWMAKQAKKFANGVKVEVKSGAELKEFGGLCAVGGSVPKPGPRFIKMTYAPKKSGAKHIVLVGKGITYDTGGISLKRPYDIMIPMKSDMAGAAACLAVMSALKDINAKVKVTALLMCAENAVSSTAQRPGDVITHYGGKTVEVLNTDAEGRLVLADGLAYAVKNLKPDYLLDIATLTGSATLGLGKQYAALYSRNPKWIKALKEAGESSGDRVWHMPLIDDYQSALESDIADINHTADKGDFNAGSVTAALFLEEFVGDINWAHLDIAGVGRAEGDAGENPKGGTGWGVRLLLEWIGSFK